MSIHNNNATVAAIGNRAPFTCVLAHMLYQTRYAHQYLLTLHTSYIVSSHLLPPTEVPIEHTESARQIALLCAWTYYTAVVLVCVATSGQPVHHPPALSPRYMTANAAPRPFASLNNKTRSMAGAFLPIWKKELRNSITKYDSENYTYIFFI